MKVKSFLLASGLFFFLSLAAGVQALDFIGPDTIANVVQEASPFVVNIIAITNLSSDELANMPRFQREANGRYKATGSGVIMRSDGYILTSLHVVQKALDIKVTLLDGRNFKAKLIGKDSYSDLAMIKIESQSLPEAKFGNPEELKLGQWLVAIGNQFGLEHTVTAGLVSGLHREAKAFSPSAGARSGVLKYIQTDAPINPGSSGGPLLNLKGEIIGINSFIRDDAQNIGFAIPATVAKEIANKLLLEGAVVRPYIGIEMKEVTVDAGVEITKVKTKSPADMAGLIPGDCILNVDGKAVNEPSQVSYAVSRHTVGESLNLKIKRLGLDRTLVVKIGSLPDDIE
ncbi:MAG: trypsin-like peptidase domain-containing protein [Candidatus Obscuribacterales bacterium]|nr:trypsin-like peptidase domain-containing protein [Candidatus Obscuribacterales bacterium]